MEKNIYETYEFLPTNSTEAESDQFFVFRNDGTLLINRPVQYVTQVQNVKGIVENGQPCSAVFDVSSQEYYVDVDNSTELISVSDQFTLPQDAVSSDFGNNYLLQPLPAIQTSSVQMAESVTIDDLKEFSVKIGKEETNPSNVQGSETTNFTEVTLNDEQYQSLEVKGWVLLVNGDKVYLLNTLGLHDITDNATLIENLRNNDEVVEPSVLNDCTKSETTFYGFEETVTASVRTKQGTQELILPDTKVDIQLQNSYAGGQSIAVVQEPPETLASANVVPVTSNLCFSESPELLKSSSVPTLTSNSNQVETPNSVSNTDVLDTTLGQALEETTAPTENSKPSMIVRLKTKIAVEDIPNKIVLGKTVNGKRLVAKVVSIKKPVASMEVCSKNEPQKPDDSSKDATIVTKTLLSKKIDKAAYYRAEEVESLIQKHMASPTELASSAEDVKRAELIIKQLLNVPATRTPMMERNLIITKIVKIMKDADSQLSESGPTLVTGRVAQFDGKGEWHFVYIPHLLQKLHKDANNDENDSTSCVGVPIRQAVMLDDYLLHIHVHETKCPNVPTKTSITFSRKHIPTRLKLLTTKSIYACSACAKIFTNERGLNEHQKIGCMDVEEEKPPLVIDTEGTSKQPISILKKNHNQTFKAKKSSPCLYCNKKVMLTSYRRHLQTHKAPVAKGAVLPKESENDTNKAIPAMHKCKMCFTSYHHASTLSKHILSHHIQSNIKICMV